MTSAESARRTTVGDVRAALYDMLWSAGVRTWFQPDLRVQRAGAANPTSRGFLAVAREDVVIQPGDLVHVDFGISYMGFDTDWQKMAYVLRPGETRALQARRRARSATHTRCRTRSRSATRARGAPAARCSPRRWPR